jgi:hypothetical protein
VKWHKTDCTGLDKAFVDGIYLDFPGPEGHEVFGVWTHLRRVMAIELDREIEAFRCGKTDIVRAIMTRDVNSTAIECKTTPENFLKFTAYFKKRGQLSARQVAAGGLRITLEMPNLLRDIDNYTRTAINGICEARKLPAQSVLKVYVESTKSVRRLYSLSRAGSSKPSEAEAEQQPHPAGDGGEPVETPVPPAGGPGPGVVPAAAPEPPSPAPTPPPRGAAAVACPAVALEPSVGASSTDINRPHALSVRLLLSHGFQPAQAKHWALQVPVREICAAVESAQGKGVRDVGAYVHSLLKLRARRNSDLTFGQAADLRQKLVEFDRLHATLDARADAYDFALRVSSAGTIAAVPQNLRAHR